METTCAGMRTNTLVCFGAAAFVDLGSTVGGASTTNIIAYVISGVGFLGAGAIMKDGGSVRGLDTAATLWCSAAVGACAGAGEMLDAAFVTILLLAINIVLRPLSRAVDNVLAAPVLKRGMYRMTVIYSGTDAPEMNTRFLRAMAEKPLTLRELSTDDTEDSQEMIIEAVLESSKKQKEQVAKLANELKLLPGVASVEWAETSLESD